MNGRRPRNRNNRKSHIPNRNQVYESSGPENKVRGTAQQIFEKYQTLARDALSSGNLVQAEAFFQHGEHYLRLHNIAVEAAAEAQERRQQQQQDRREPRGDGGDRQNDRQGGERQGGERQGGERQGGERQGGERQNDRQNDRRRDRRDRKDRPGMEARDRSNEGDEQVLRTAEAVPTASEAQSSAPGVDPSEMEQPDLGQMPAFLSDKLPLPAAEPTEASSTSSEEEKPAPKRRGRPPKAKAAEGEAGEEKPAPKRRGRPPKAKVAEAEGSDGEAASSAPSGDDLSDAA